MEAIYDEHDILELLDEYSLYCYYLGYEPIIGKSYRSPIRKSNALTRDDVPSFDIYVRKFGGNRAYEYMWKDKAGGAINYGNIFTLVRLLLGLKSEFEAKLRVVSDLIIDNKPSPALSYYEPEHSVACSIRIKSRAFTVRDDRYWGQYNISRELLTQYDVKALSYYWLNEMQSYPNRAYGLAYAYNVLGRHQLYFPYAAREFKFRNDWTEKCVFGWKQLTFTKPLIITKSAKDVLCLASLGFEAITPRGENILLPPECLAVIDKRYKDNVITLFDNDGKHSAEKYSYRATQILLEFEAKDPTDYCAKYGPDNTRELVNQLLYDT